MGKIFYFCGRFFLPMEFLDINPNTGEVLSSTLMICNEGRCSFELEGEHYELARASAIVLRKGQTVSSLNCSEDFSATCLEAPAQLFARKEANADCAADRKDELFKKFTDLLRLNYSREHEADFYARQLHITPKYLTLVCKDRSGRSVKEWIDHALLRDASFMLRNTDKTISQIASSLHFDSAELFGKFFKRMSHFSPRQFRLLDSE